MIDFHNHILPNVDDGSKSMDMSLSMFEYAFKQGITDVVNTVHYQHPKVEHKSITFKIINEKISEMQDVLNENDVVVTSDGTAVVTTFQGAKIKKNQRLFSNSGSASMGYGLPAAIGACLSNNREMTVCIEGDGSLQQNIQELATITYHKLPLKLFVLSNDGYHSIRQTQTNYFPDNIIGCGLESGLYFPDLQLIAKSYGLDYMLIENTNDLKRCLKKVFKDERALIVEVKIDKTQSFEPKASSKIFKNGRMKSAPLHDLAPFLDQDEIESIINFEN